MSGSTHTCDHHLRTSSKGRRFSIADLPLGLGVHNVRSRHVIITTARKPSYKGLKEVHLMLLCSAQDRCVQGLRRALCQAMNQGQEIMLLTCCPAPCGAPPNVKGVVCHVGCGTVKLLLTSGPPGRMGVFSLCHIIGFVPKEECCCPS